MVAGPCKVARAAQECQKKNSHCQTDSTERVKKIRVVVSILYTVDTTVSVVAIVVSSFPTMALQLGLPLHALMLHVVLSFILEQTVKIAAASANNKRQRLLF